MKTLVYPPQSGIGHTTYVGVVAHHLTEREAFGIANRLAGDGLLIWPEIDTHRVLHLRPLEPMTTAAEVTVLAAYKARTDMPVRWDGPPRQRVSPCLMCGATWVVLEHDLCVPCGLAFQPAGAVAP